jgi:ABC-type glycerol-3-phosphate transport system substrate-binding protein
MKKPVIMLMCSVFLVLAAVSPLTAGGEKESAQKGPVAIEWWGEFTGFEAKGTEFSVSKFNETHPNIQVKYIGQPDLDKKVIAAVMAGNPPPSSLSVTIRIFHSWWRAVPTRLLTI